MTIDAPRRAFPRSILYTPALDLGRVLAAQSYDADVHLIDLEDSVPPGAKEGAREICVAALSRSATSARLAVRINNMYSIDAIQDIAALAASPVMPGFVFMTMVRSPTEPVQLREIFAGIGREPEIYVTIETVQAVNDAKAIAAVSDGMILGAADLSATLGIEITWAGLLLVRQTMVLACAQHGIACIDTGNFQVGNSPLLEDEVSLAKMLGFHGKGTVHPRELAQINRMFRPNAAAAHHAERVLAAVRDAAGGVCMLDGTMIGPPFARRARAVLAHGEAWLSRFGPASMAEDGDG